MSNQRFQGRERYLVTSSPQTSFELAHGYYVSNTATNAAYHVPYHISDARGFRLTFFGTGADNATFDYRIWAVIGDRVVLDTPTDFMLEYFGGGTATLSTLMGASATSLITSSERIADTLTFTLATSITTPKGPATVWESYYNLGDTINYSPTANNAASLIIPNFTAGSMIVEFDLTGATAANCTIERTR